MIARLTLVTLFSLGVPEIGEAQLGLNCSISTTPVALGDYSVLSPAAKTTTGSVTYQCTIGVNIIVALARGSASTFEPRTMRNGSEVLNYNLYRDASFATIWGDGTRGTATYSALATVVFPTTVTVYGQLPAGQDVAVGSYGDAVVATIIF